MNASATSDSTSSSLLQRAREHDPQAWQRLAELYGPVVYGWVRRAGFREHDAADIVQEVYQAVFTSLGNFRYERPTDRFRDWLWTITHRRACDWLRKRATQPAAPGGTAVHELLNNLPARLPEEPLPETPGARAELAARALELVRPEFSDHVWQACLQTVAGRAPADVAADLQMSVGAVYVARSRVLKRLRRELDGLL